MDQDKLNRFMKLKKTMQERNEIIQNDKEKKKNINKKEKLLIYQKMLKEKKELIHKNIVCVNPFIYTINNFLLPFECEHIIELSKNKLKDATLSTSYGNIVDNRIRNNKLCWINHNESWVCEILCKRLENLLKIPIENAEKIQVVHYKIGQHFNAHTDSYIRDGSEKSNHSMKYGGQRIFTCLIYLNDVDEGGETYFTEIDHCEKPERGKIIVFKNCDNKKDRNNMSRHMGCDVKKGEKYAINLWFREKKIDLLNPFKYVPLKKYTGYLDEFYKNILKGVYTYSFEFVQYNEMEEISILKDLANNHFENNYLFGIDVNSHKYNKYIMVNKYKINSELIIKIKNYYTYCSKNIKQKISNDIISKTLQYELLEYFKLFTGKSLIPYHSELCWYEKGDTFTYSNYTVLININNYSFHMDGIYLEQNGIMFMDDNTNCRFDQNGEFLILIFKLKE